MPVSYPPARIDATLAHMKPIFFKVFEAGPADVEFLLFTFAPGRVNFYGEHTDYMGGYVCPGGLREGCHILVGRVKAGGAGGQRGLRFGTTKGEAVEITSLDEGAAKGKGWSTFARGAAAITLADLKLSLEDYKGICVLSHGTLPMGSGMSASASYDVTLLYALRHVGLRSYERAAAGPGRYPELSKGSREDKIALTKQALLIETKYCGVNVGIMDQFSCVHATAGRFMALDCATLTYKDHVIGNLTGPDHCFLLINSMVKHELTGADHSNGYNAIRRDIEGAEAAVSKVQLGGKPFRFCELARHPERFTKGDPVAFVEAAASAMTPAEHARGIFNLREQIRTLEFIGLTDPQCPLAPAQRVARAGELLNATHQGQRDILGISTPELDLIQSEINKHDGVAGGRLMGGGFGGCVLLLLRADAKERVVAAVTKAFKQRFGIEPEAYPVELCDGAFTVSLYKSQSHV